MVNYYFKENTKNCYNVSSEVQGYYFDTNANLFKKCSSNCFNCNGPYDNNCKECDNIIHFFKEDNDNVCYNNNTLKIGYYLDLNDTQFKKCNPECYICVNTADNCI